MRNALSVVVLLAMAFAGASASASTYTDASDLPPGSYAASFHNFSDLYYAQGTSNNITEGSTIAGANGAPLLFGGTLSALSAAAAAYGTGGANAAGTLEDRTIFNGSLIDDANGHQVWTAFPTGSRQLSALAYDLTLISVTVNSPTSATLYFGADTRSNPLAGSPGYSGAPAGSGGVIQIYESSAETFNADPNGVGNLESLLPESISSVNGSAAVNHGVGGWGPSSWVVGAGTASDSYVGASGAPSQLWLEGEFVPFASLGITGAPVGTVYEESISLANGQTGSSIGYIYLTGGSDYAKVADPGDMGLPGVDMLISADEATPGISGANLTAGTPGYTGVGYWPIDSHDPFQFEVIATVSTPEPISMIFFGTGLVAVGGYMARRKMARKP